MSTDHRDQVRQAIDLVELVSQSVALKRRGRKFVGLCPFHQEKTPSFTVDPAKQYFHCFGCKASGTVFDFVMRRDRVEFREALEILARQAGIELPRSGAAGQKAGDRQALLEAHSAACAFFQNLLRDPVQGAVAREYLTRRGFTPQTLQRFQVGLAADAWDALLRGPVGRKHGPQLLALAGLVKPREHAEGYYDTFRNRIMFPIRNEGGQIIAFGGRVMPGSQDPAKYLNSPETPLFSKSRAVFGLDLARQRIVETRVAAVVEGYTDVMMAHQFGAANVVSVLGTALTEQHVNVLRRFADRIVLVFDADAAGDAAVARVLNLYLRQPVEIAVACIPDGLDPDEFLLRDGLSGFQRLLADAPDALLYAWRRTSRRHDAQGADLTTRQKVAAEYLELLSQANAEEPTDALRLGGILARVSRLTDVPLEDLHRRFRRMRKVARPGRTIASAAGGQAPRKPVAVDGRLRAERQILGVLLVEPQRWSSVQLCLQVEEITDPALRRLAEALWNHQRHEGETVLGEFLSALSDPALQALAVELVEEIEAMPDPGGTLEGAMAFLAEERRKREKQQTFARTQRLKEEPCSPEAEAELLRQLQELSRRPDLRRVRA